MDAEQALGVTLYAYLKGDGTRLWGNRVVPTEVAASGTDYPYVSYFFSGGGREEVAAWRQHERMLVTIKAVCGDGAGISSPMAVALDMKEDLIGLLDDAGEQDFNSRFGTHADWRFLAITRRGTVSLVVQLPDSKWSYHRGNVYEFFMERK